MQPFELRSDGVLLAIPTVDDIDRITECCQDPQIQKWITSIPIPYSADDAKKFVTEICPSGWSEEKELAWAIRDPENRRFLGMLGIRPHNNGLAEIGFWLAPDARGRHIVSRAVRLAASYAFDPEGLGVTHLQWWALVGNWPSRRVAWATGFEFGGTVSGGLGVRGERRDAWLATLHAGEPMKPRTTWLDVPTLHGSRVTLRPFAQSDAEAVVEACNDPLTQHWLSTLPSPYTRTDALKYLESRWDEPARGTGVHWAATVSDGGPARGSFSLMGLDRRSGGAEVGYWVHPDVRGKAVATEAVGLMLRHAFTNENNGGLGLRRVIVAHVVGNEGSRLPIERNGFKLIGDERAVHQFRDGSVGDRMWYDLLADEFQPD